MPAGTPLHRMLVLLWPMQRGLGPWLPHLHSSSPILGCAAVLVPHQEADCNYAEPYLSHSRAKEGSLSSLHPAQIPATTWLSLFSPLFSEQANYSNPKSIGVASVAIDPILYGYRIKVIEMWIH